MQRREHHQGKGSPLQHDYSQWLPKGNDHQEMNYKAGESARTCTEVKDERIDTLCLPYI